MWQTVSSSWIYGQSSIIIARVYRNRHSEALKDLYLSNGYVPHEGAPLSHHIIISTWVCFRSQVCFAIFAFILCVVIPYLSHAIYRLSSHRMHDSQLYPSFNKGIVSWWMFAAEAGICEGFCGSFSCEEVVRGGIFSGDMAVCFQEDHFRLKIAVFWSFLTTKTAIQWRLFATSCQLTFTG